jgi:myo-inositol 2-dehydrogenase / D-chiro-inositol 1-dehydrogenase
VTSEGKVLGVGVIGVGSIGKVHAENLTFRVPNAKLVAIADTDLSAAETLASTLGVKTVYSDYRKLIEDETVEAVLIAVPTFLKKDMVIAASEAGKDIFCEKPMALSLSEADEMVRAEKKAGIKFQIGFMRRFDHSHIGIKGAIDRGELGRVLMIRSNGRDPGKVSGWGADPKLSGGVFSENCSHDFDMFRWLSGSEVTKVYAEGAALVFDEVRKKNDYDTAAILLRSSTDTIGQVDTGYSVYGHDVRVEVLGTEGAIMMSMGSSTNTVVLKKDTVSNVYPSSYPERFSQAYRDELADFAKSVQTDRQPLVTSSDGRAALEIALAAMQASKESAAVSLPLR